MRPQVYAVLCNYSTDPSGNPLALVIYANRSFEYIPHKELNEPQRVLQEV